MMPDMSGPDLALKLKDGRPEMRVILMSGYADGRMLVFNYGWYFIEKPFVPVQLVAKINEVWMELTRQPTVQNCRIPRSPICSAGPWLSLCARIGRQTATMR
jgi:FixJ family two-component response regulator